MDKPKATTPRSLELTAKMDEPVDKNEGGDYWGLFKQHFGAEAELAYAVAKAESGVVSKAGAVNMDGSQDWGVMQINDRWHCPKVGAEAFSEDCHNKLLDVETNVRVAKQIRDDSGWGAWSVINNGRYLNFM